MYHTYYSHTLHIYHAYTIHTYHFRIRKWKVSGIQFKLPPTPSTHHPHHPQRPSLHIVNFTVIKLCYRSWGENQNQPASAWHRPEQLVPQAHLVMFVKVSQVEVFAEPVTCDLHLLTLTQPHQLRCGCLQEVVQQLQALQATTWGVLNQSPQNDLKHSEYNDHKMTWGVLNQSPQNDLRYFESITQKWLQVFWISHYKMARVDFRQSESIITNPVCDKQHTKVTFGPSITEHLQTNMLFVQTMFIEIDYTQWN